MKTDGLMELFDLDGWLTWQKGRQTIYFSKRWVQLCLNISWVHNMCVLCHSTGLTFINNCEIKQINMHKHLTSSGHRSRTNVYTDKKDRTAASHLQTEEVYIFLPFARISLSTVIERTHAETQIPWVSLQDWTNSFKYSSLFTLRL